MLFDPKARLPSNQLTFARFAGQSGLGLDLEHLAWRVETGDIIDPRIEAANMTGVDNNGRALFRAVGAVVKEKAPDPRIVTYHNMIHYAEVTAGTVILIKHITPLIPPTMRELHARLSDLTVAAAMGHDAGHDGTSNTDEQGNHTPYRLEDISMGLIEPALVAHGVSDQEINFIHALLRCTDVTTPLNENDPVIAEAIEDYGRENFILYAAVLKNADLMTSAHLSQKCAFINGEKLSIENKGKTQPTIASHSWFFENIARPAINMLPDPIQTTLRTRGEQIVDRWKAMEAAPAMVHA